MRAVVGLDISMRKSGIGYIDADTGQAHTRLVRTKRTGDLIIDDMATFHEAVDGIIAHVEVVDPVLVVMEAAEFVPGRNKNNNFHSRAGIWWAAGGHLARRYPVVTVAPASLKLWAAFDGSATKEDMIDAVLTAYGPGVLREDGLTTLPKTKLGLDDRADGLCLAGIGVQGIGGHSMFGESQLRAQVVAGLDWSHYETMTTMKEAG